MPTPKTKLTTAELTSMASSTLGNLKPYQLDQVKDALSRLNWGSRGSVSDMSGQPTITTIISTIGSNEP